MDNWNAGDSDSMVANLQYVDTAEGSLQEQADIYAESWEAARDRVTAAAEEIYNELLNDDFFIALNNGFASFLGVVSNTIDALGGLPGVLSVASRLMFKIFGSDMATAIENWGYNIKLRTQEGRDSILKMRQDAIEALKNIYINTQDAGPMTYVSGATFVAQASIADELLAKQQELARNGATLSEEDSRQVQFMMQISEQMGQQAVNSAQHLENLQEQTEALETQLKLQIRNSNATRQKKDAAINNMDSAKQQQIQYTQLEATLSRLKSMKFSNITDLKNELTKIVKTAEDAGQNVDILYRVLNALNNDSSITTVGQGYDAMDKILIRIGNTAEATFRTFRESLLKVQLPADQVDEILNNLLNSWTQQGVITEQVAAKLRKVGEQAEQAGEKIRKMESKDPDFGQGIVALSNILSSVAMSITTIKGMFETWSDEDMSFGDKLLSTFTSLGMVIPMVTNAFGKNNIAMLTSVSSSLAAAAGFDTTAFSAKIAKGGIEGVWTALWPIAAAAAAVAAALALLVLAIKSVETASQKASKRLTQLQEDASQAAEILDEAQASYNDLQDTVKAYSDARDNIDSLTQGTEEFKNAILEANEAARTLIELYGVASQYNADTGLIEIDSVNLKKAVEKEQKKIENARTANIAAQSNKISASTDLTNAKVVEKDDVGYWERIFSIDSLQTLVGSTIVGGELGLAGGPFAPLTVAAGTIAGVVTGLIDVFTESYFEIKEQNSINEQQIAALEALENAYSQSGGNFEIAIDSLTDSEKALIDSLEMTDTELADLCAEVSANTSAILQNNKELIDSDFENNKEYKNSQHKDQLNTIMANELTNKTNSLYDEKWKDGKGITDREAQQAYAEMMGYTWVKNESGNLGIYSKGDGSADFTVSDETARRALAQKEALEAVGQSIAEYNNTLETINKTGNGFGKGVSNLMLRLAGGQSASFSDATGTEIKNLQTAINSAQKATDIISNEDAQNMGWKDAKAYVQALQLGIESYNDSMSKVGKTLSDSISQDFLTDVKDLSLDGAQSMANNLDDAFKVAGIEAADALDDIFVNANEDADELSTLLEDVDWGDPNAIEKLNEAIKEQKINVDISSDAWKIYTGAMLKAGLAINGIQTKFENFRETLANIKDITKNLEKDSIISDEDYNKLIEINPVIKDLFMITTEGYQFLGSQDNLSSLLTNNIKESISEIKQQFSDLSNEGKILTNTNWFDENGNTIFDSDRAIAQIGDMVSDDTLFDASLAYMGVSKDSLQEASQYILDYTDEQGNILTNKDSFDQAKYDKYFQFVKNAYIQLGGVKRSYLNEEFSEKRAEELIASTAATLPELQALYSENVIGSEAYDKQLTNLAKQASSLEELQNIRNAVIENEAYLSDGEYGDALLDLAENYSNCTEEIEEYNKALLIGDSNQIAAAQSALELSIKAGELAKNYDLDAEALENYSKRLQKNSEDQALSANTAIDLAMASMRLDRGMKNVNTNLKNYKNILKDSNKLTSEYSETMDDLKANLADIFNVAEGNMFSDTFAQGLLDSKAFEKALNGDIEALNSLRASATIDIGNNIISSLGEEADIKQTEFRNAAGEIVNAAFTAQSAWDYISSILQNDDFTLKEINDEKFVESLNQMIQSAGMTKDQVQSMLGAMGVSAKVVTNYEEQETEVPTYYEYSVSEGNSEFTYEDSDGHLHTETRPKIRKMTVPGAPVKIKGYVPVYSIETTSGDTTSGGEIDYSSTFTPASPPSISYGSTTSGVNSSEGGGSSSSKPAEKKKESDVVERYKEITDALDDVTRATEKASEAAGRLYGKSRIDAMNQANASLQQEISLLKQKKSEAENYLDIDKAALDAAASAAGVLFTYDSEGNISNYTSQMQALLNQYNALVDQVNANGVVSEEEQNKLDSLLDLIDKLKEAISQYDDTRELLQKLEEEIADKFYKWQDNNYQKITYSLELNLNLHEMDLKYIDYYLKTIKDDFYSLAEAAQFTASKFSSIEGELGAYRDMYYELERQKRNGDISPANYIEGLKEAYDGIISQLQALNDLDKEMMEYYENTLKKASEELDKYTSRMEHLTSVLDHYKTLVELINGEYDYESIGKILDGRVKTLKNELDVSVEYYQMLLSQREELEQQLAEAQTEAARELIQGEINAINTSIDEAQEDVLAKTEEWAEAVKAVMENTMAEAAAAMEDAFTEGMGFDALTDSLKRLSTYADEYLTKTNQIYETQKLINTAQQAADKTTNEAAKARLKAYTDEVKELQDKNQLSNLELKIAQAKYQVVLAEIALEEAQKAKSTVRLQRDSEGNFGYVYTADQDAISQAEQDLADAQNSLYNIGLKGTNDYGQKILKLQQELSDALIQIEENRAVGQYATDEEYYAARDQLIQEYNNLFRAYSEQYTTALGVDTAIQEEAWVNAYQNMIYKTADWQETTTEYTGLCEEAYRQWRDTVEAESEIIDTVLNDLETEVDNVTTASQELRDEVVDEVIPALDDQLSSVSAVTRGYSDQREEILELIDHYKALAEAIRNVVAEESGLRQGEEELDFSKDYSLLMNEAALKGMWDDVYTYAELRDRKIAAGYSDHGISTEVLLNWLLEHGGVTDEYIDWHKIIPGLATGGYTGSWGPEGRLALLHQKELVLNENDTSNFLSAVTLLRDAANMIDLKATRSRASILPYTPISEPLSARETFDQNIRIEANFPNVQDRNEIQEAFNNLINTASQYANRK